MPDSKANKVVIRPKGIRVHRDLEILLEKKGYRSILVLANPPLQANQEELIYLVTEELERLAFDPQDGDVTAVIGGMGIGSQWIAVIEAVKAKISGSPYVIMPRYEGREGKFTCWLGEEQASLP